MNTKILEKLTFGFEIEGGFSDKLAGLRGKWTEDGSVHDLEDQIIPFNLLTLDECESDEECETCNGSGQYTQECDCDSELVCEIEEHDHNGECYDEQDNLICETEEHEHSWAEECYTTPCADDDDYHVFDCDDCNGTGYISGGDATASEYNSPVFQKFEDALKVLSEFNKDNYVWNSTCGLHFHIGVKDPNMQAKLFGVASNMEFMTKLYREALTEYCPCQKERLMFANHFCQFYQNSKHLAANTKGSQEYGYGESKYLFCRFHPETITLEFRFFRPCEHKVENVKKLVNSLVDYLQSEFTTTRYAMAETGTNTTEWKNDRVAHTNKEYFEQKTKTLDDFEQEYLNLLTRRGYYIGPCDTFEQLKDFENTMFENFKDEYTERKARALANFEVNYKARHQTVRYADFISGINIDWVDTL